MASRQGPRFGILVLLTYGIVILFTLLAAVAYFYTRSELQPGDQADPNPMRRMMVGAVWVPIFPEATYYEPNMVEQKEIATGTVKFRTKEPAGSVLAFYEGALRESGFLPLTTGNAGGTIQAVRRGGRISVTVSATTSSQNTTGEIHTLNHRDPNDSKQNPAR
jgi:hypothetical protein